MKKRIVLIWYSDTENLKTLIGWAGVDGIHFCMIRGFGEMVFAVSPIRSRTGNLPVLLLMKWWIQSLVKRIVEPLP